MNSTLNDYIEAFKNIHMMESFWVFNSSWDLQFANNANYNLYKLKVYSPTREDILPFEEVLQSIKSNASLPINNIEFESMAFYEDGKDTNTLLLQSSPIRDGAGEIVGFFVICRGSMSEFEHLSLLRYLVFAGNNEESYKRPTRLGNRELEVLFFIVRGKSYQEIANILSRIHHKPISNSTIGNMVRNSLYAKFDVFNKMALKKQCYNQECVVDCRRAYSLI